MYIAKRAAVIFSIVACLGLIVLSISILINYQIVLAENGVCKAAGRVLTADEHRRAFFRSLTALYVEKSNRHHKLTQGASGVYTGIILDPPERDFISLIAEFSSNNKSFEENFQIKIIAPESVGVRMNQVIEPLAIISYEVADGGRAVFIDSRSIKRIVPQKGDGVLDSFSLLERYRGYGNYFYEVERVFLNIQCCDTRSYSKSAEAYLESKSLAHNQSLKSLQDGIARHILVAVVSNCGDVKAKDVDNGFGTQTVEWITF